MTPFDEAWLVATIAIMAPLLLAATGEVVSQKSGVLNVGLEGFMLTGAFFGLLGAASLDGSIAGGLFVGVVAGMAIAAIMATATVAFQADQVVIGVGINLLALGVTGFLFDEVASDIAITQLHSASIPFLSDLPFVGSVLFSQKVTVYIVLVIVSAVWWCLYRTKLGITIRGSGDYPSAVDTAGYNVTRVRFFCVLFAGAAAGGAGAMLSVAEVGIFQDGMVNGRGFLALAAVILGRWHPFGVLAAVALFAGADALQLRLQAQGSISASVWFITLSVGGFLALSVIRKYAILQSIFGGSLFIAILTVLLIGLQVIVPFQLWRALPFLLTLIVLLFFSSSVKAPAYLTVHFRRKQ